MVEYGDQGEEEEVGVEVEVVETLQFGAPSPSSRPNGDGRGAGRERKARSAELTYTFNVHGSTSVKVVEVLASGTLGDFRKAVQEEFELAEEGWTSDPPVQLLTYQGEDLSGGNSLPLKDLKVGNPFCSKAEAAVYLVTHVVPDQECEQELMQG